MKSYLLPTLMALVLMANSAEADTSISVRLGEDHQEAREHFHEGDRDHQDYWAYDRDGNRRYYRRRRMVEGVPAVVAPVPYYGGDAYTSTPPLPGPSATGLTGDYATDLANLNGKLSRLRAIVQRQKQKDSISQEQYDGFMTVLEGIEHEEHTRAFDQGGTLAPEDLLHLSRRLDQASEDIQIALAQ